MKSNIGALGVAFRKLFCSFIWVLYFNGCLCQSLMCMEPDGDKTVSNGGTIINAYTPLLAPALSGATSISANIDSLNNGNPLDSGSLIMVIGMQGATIDTTDTYSYGNILDYNSAGKYEFVVVKSLSGSSAITLRGGLSNTYAVGGTNRVQVVRVPQYNSLTINSGASITGLPWNGSCGGVVAAYVCDTATVNGSIDADTIGFRGGALDDETSYGITDFVGTDPSMGGEKGEGIAGFESDYDMMGGRYCRGAPANGGGGGEAWNSGGGGGANGNNCIPWTGLGNPDTTGGAVWDSAWSLDTIPNFAISVSSGGGRAGYTWANAANDPATTAPDSDAWSGDNRRNVGGWGGRPLNIDPENTIFFGGGGGAGDQDQDNGTPGGRGGGIVYIVAKTFSGNGIVTANGQSADTSGFDSTMANDGPGGGGGGGTIIILSEVSSTLTLHADGGQGGNQINAVSSPNPNESEGPGGGGGGGYIFINSGTPLMTVKGGLHGNTNSTGVTGFPPNGSTSGGSGQIGNCVTGIANEKNALADITVFPNPSNGSFYFKGVCEGNIIDIYDLLSEMICSSKVNNDNYGINLSGSARGIYFYRVTANQSNDTEIIGTGKIILQ